MKSSDAQCNGALCALRRHLIIFNLNNNWGKNPASRVFFPSMWVQLFFLLIEKQPFAAPPGALELIFLDFCDHTWHKPRAPRRGCAPWPPRRRRPVCNFRPKNCFFVSPPRASNFGALCHAPAPTPSAAARAPAAASMVARAPRGGAYFTGRHAIRGETTNFDGYQNQIPRGVRRHDVHIGLAAALLCNVHHILR